MVVQHKFQVNGKMGNNLPSARCTSNIRGYGSSKYSDPYAIEVVIDERVMKFRKCNTNRCLTCPMADENHIIDSKEYKYQLFCKAYNCIYCITCGCCGMKYVGQTKTPLHLRVNVHRNHITKNTPEKEHQVEYDHFKMHEFKNAKISILNIERNHNERLMMENLQIIEKNSIFPYGLNQILNNKNMVKNNFDIDKNSISIYNILKKNDRFPFKRLKRGKKKNKQLVNKEEEKEKIKIMEEKFNQDYDIGYIKNYMLSKTKKCINNVIKIIQNGEYKMHFKHLIFDLAIHRAQHLKINVNILNTKQREKTFCIIKYTSKKMDHVNFNMIFDKAKKYFPIKNMYIKRAYKYGKTIGRTIFNYNQVAKNFKGTQKEINDAICICDKEEYLKYVDNEHGHVITGNLDIVNNKKLSEIMSFGTKYRLNTLNNSKYIEKGVYKDLLCFVNKMSAYWSMPTGFFEEWKQIVHSKIKTQIKKNRKYGNVSNVEIKNGINDLQNYFVVTYADKAPNNFSIICKKFYLQNLLAIFNNNDTYEQSKEGNVSVNKRIIACYKRINKKEENLHYPYLVLIPKHHKKPVTFRTVTMGHNTYNSKANKILLEELRKIEMYIQKNFEYIFIKNSLELKEKFKSIEKCKKVYRIQTYDVKDLFNNLDQKDIYNIIIELYIEFKNNIKFKMDIVEFKFLLKLVIFNNFIKMGGHIYKQIKGLQQGMICSTIAANLALFQYERRNCKINDNYIEHRYLDDIIRIYLNENEEEKNFDDIYPGYIQLIKSMDSNKRANFLDLDIHINDGSIITDIHHKQNDMPFNMIKMQHFSSNVHREIFINIIYNGMIRIHSLCDNENQERNMKFLQQNARQYGYPDEVFKIAKKKMYWKRKMLT